MDAHTSAIAADAARVSTRHTLKLSVVHLEYAAQIVAYAPPVEYHPCKLVRLCAKTKRQRPTRLQQDRWPLLRREPRCLLRGDSLARRTAVLH